MATTDQSCGIGRCHPPWLQKLATPRCFLVVYSLMGIVQGISSSYSTATLSTLEKRFKIPTQTIGVLKTGNELSQILLCLAVGYLGGRGSRPRWLAWGVVASAASSYLLGLLHVWYGPGREALALTEEHFDISVFNASLPSQREVPLLCQANRTSSEVCQQEHTTSGEYSLTPLILIFLSEIMFGVGYTTSNMLGQTYMDDHVKKKNTPFLLGVIMSTNMFGPALGFSFSSYCLRLYVDPTLTPVIQREDPRWIGAWWLGWMLLGSVKLLMALLVAFFPKALPRRDQRSAGAHGPREERALTRLGDAQPLTPSASAADLTALKHRGRFDQDSFLQSLLRLLKNKVLICNIIANSALIMGAYGYWLYLVKYTETQYHKSASGASMVAGVTFIVAISLGMMCSGLIMGKFRPGAKVVLSWNIFIGLLHVAGSLSLIFLGCKANGVYGVDIFRGTANFQNECNDMCDCQNVKYQPVCYAEKSITFFSPCHIGCKSNYLDTNGSVVYFTNCTCIPDVWFNKSSPTRTGGYSASATVSYLDEASVTIANGPCPVDCSAMLHMYLGILFVIELLLGSGRVANVVLNLRCVDEKDKTLAQGLSLLVISVFGLLPTPIIYGALMDTTCLVWDSSCDSKGNCWIYDNNKFRLYFNLMGAGAIAISTLLDIKLLSLAKNLNLYDAESEEKEEILSENKPSILVKVKN
ncbi:solute carrier organic anion transporter family member 74D-like [Bacillus rossius redtenbacheri]|uniref:solute carrier organic anion transporter family member 74D-like n=1 Tax=Bacillus rossius redtenbacheri TaxID=93214 RepID=UPI002FDD8327